MLSSGLSCIVLGLYRHPRRSCSCIGRRCHLRLWQYWRRRQTLGDLHSFKLPSNIFRSRCQSCVDHCLQITGGINSLIWVHCQAGDRGKPWLQRTPGCLFWVERPPHLQTQKITGSSTYWIPVRILLHTPGSKSHSPLVPELIKYPDASKTRNTVRKFTPLNVSTSSPQNNSGINDERSKSPNALVILVV